jgi:hypothetical protein
MRAARKRGLSDPESVASDIMLVFLEKDYLEKFDPSIEGATTFESWVNAVIYKRLNNAYRDENRRAMGHTVPIMDHDELITEEPVAEFKLLAMSCFELLRDRYGMELAEVWVSIVKQVVEDTTAKTGRARQWLMAKHLAVGEAKVSSLMSELRNVIVSDAELREMLSADSWASQAA